jgi:hypothetical protein
MNNTREYKRKQPEASNDYQKAYNIIKTLEPGTHKTVKIDNVKAFRKYLTDLNRSDKSRIFRTIMNQNKLNITVYRLS